MVLGLDFGLEGTHSDVTQTFTPGMTISVSSSLVVVEAPFAMAGESRRAPSAGTARRSRSRMTNLQFWWCEYRTAGPEWKELGVRDWCSARGMKVVVSGGVVRGSILRV